MFALTVAVKLKSIFAATAVLVATLTQALVEPKRKACRYILFVEAATDDCPFQVLEAASDADDLYIAALSKDTKTYTAAGIKVRIGLSF